MIFYDFLIVMKNDQRLFHWFPEKSPLPGAPKKRPGASRPHGRDVILRGGGRRFDGRLRRRLAGGWGWGSWGSWGLAFLGDFLGGSGVFECSFCCECLIFLIWISWWIFKLKLIEVPNSELDCDFWEFISVDCQLDWFSLWRKWYFNVVGRQFRCPGGNDSRCIFLSPNHGASNLIADHLSLNISNLLIKNSIRFNVSPMAPIRFKRWSKKDSMSLQGLQFSPSFFFRFFFSNILWICGMNTLWWTNSLPWKDPPFLMGKSTISMAIFNSYVSHYQRVITIKSH